MSPFEVIPAIDLLGGRCARLAQGDYRRPTYYSDDPGAVAAGFVAAGAPRLHLIDLDGARTGSPQNRDAVERVLEAVGSSIPVQLGGGLRDLPSLTAALTTGVDRVILGTAALRDPEFLETAVQRFPGRIALALDARDGHIAVAGWLETTQIRVDELAARYAHLPLAALIYTDIARDGVRTGPDLETAVSLALTTPTPVIASGGVGCEDDLHRAARYAQRGLAGLIIGRALYTGDLDLGRALQIAACS